AYGCTASLSAARGWQASPRSGARCWCIRWKACGRRKGCAPRSDVSCPFFRFLLSLFCIGKIHMANYVYTMNRVGKIVPPKRQILKDISLSFFPGAKIGVLGLNGSGKSTLLKIMAGIDTDIQGEAVPM